MTASTVFTDLNISSCPRGTVGSSTPSPPPRTGPFSLHSRPKSNLAEWVFRSSLELADWSELVPSVHPYVGPRSTSKLWEDWWERGKSPSPFLSWDCLVRRQHKRTTVYRMLWDADFWSCIRLKKMSTSALGMATSSAVQNGFCSQWKQRPVVSRLFGN